MDEPTHLIVLVHGLGGAPGDLKYLSNQLKERSSKTLVVLAQANAKQTRDGVENGGLRLSQEIRALAAANPTLKALSIIGNSLGGIYARFAIGHLDYDSTNNTFLGHLKPAVFMTIASPHLGTRCFTYIPIPSCFYGLVGLLFGKSGSDLFYLDKQTKTPKKNVRNSEEVFSSLSDHKPIVLAIGTDYKYLIPLRAFQHRRLYANRSKDMMVPMGTAAFQNNLAGASELEIYPSTAKKGKVRAWQLKTVRKEWLVDNPLDLTPFQLEEDGIASFLNECGWEKIIVEFPGCIPDAHNKICAWSRNQCGIYMYKSGRVVMDHAVSFLFSSTLVNSNFGSGT